VADKLLGVSVGDQRIKWLVVVVLAAILLAVIVWGNDAPPVGAGAAASARARHEDSARRPAPISGKAAVETAPRNAAKAAVKKSRTRWKFADALADELELTLKFNPFAPKPALEPQLANGATAISDPNQIRAEEERAEQARALAAQQRLTKFRGQKVSVFLRTSDGGSAALIGGRVVREGDVVDGVRVLSISADAVVLEAAPPTTD